MKCKYRGRPTASAAEEPPQTALGIEMDYETERLSTIPSSDLLSDCSDQAMDHAGNRLASSSSSDIPNDTIIDSTNQPDVKAADQVGHHTETVSS